MGPKLQLSENDRVLLARFDLPEPQQDFAGVLQNLMAFRNEWVLHKRKCDFTGKDIVSAYPERCRFPVYKNDIWWGDAWDPSSYGKNIDFSQPFFSQMAGLQELVPREGTSVFNSENCEYNSHIRESRNCYLNSLVHKCEDTHYSYWVVNDKDVVDCLLVNNSTLAYNCVDCENLYECVTLQDCQSCSDCHFSYQLRACEHCIGCYNLTNQRYCIQNKPVSEQEYKNFKAQLLNGTQAGYRRGEQLFNSVMAQAPHRALHNLNVEDALGDHLINCRRCNYSFDGSEGEDVNYAVSFGPARSILACYSAGWPQCENIYTSVVTRGSENIAFCYYTFYSSGLMYCDSSMSCHDCFGCVGMRQARNCILNKAYSVHEYQTLRKKLVAHMKASGEWGQFPSTVLSSFPYNQSAAQQYFPLTPEAALRAGWIWQDYDAFSAEKSPAAPVDLNSISEQNLDRIYRSERSITGYRIIKPELNFYRKMSLPPPRLSPQERHQQRLASRNLIKLYTRNCSVSGKEMLTSFAPEQPVKVVSEEEYVKSLNQL